MRTTVKSYLKTIEKAKAEAKVAELATADNEVQPEQTNTVTNGQGEVNGPMTMVIEAAPASTEERETTPANDVQPSIEVSRVLTFSSSASHTSMQDPDPDSYEPDDDHVEIQVEPDEDQEDIPSQNKFIVEDPAEDQYNAGVEASNNKNSALSNNQDQAIINGMDPTDFSNMMNGFNNMDYNQMMQMMAANGMGNFNPMMGKFALQMNTRVVQLTVGRNAHGNEFNVTRHVWWIWRSQWRHE